MPAIALADLLPDFGVQTSAVRNPAPAFAAEENPKKSSEESVEDLVAQRVSQAEVEIAERLAREYEAKLEAERQRHAVELETVVARLTHETAEAMAVRFSESEQEIEAKIAAVTARILSAALTENLCKRAIDELVGVIGEAMRDRQALRIRVRGPEVLEAVLRERLGERAAQMDFSEAPGIDLTAEIEDSLFETRIAEWAAALSEVLS